MNYLWELLLRAQEQGIQKENLRFVPAKSYSPYVELSKEALNYEQVDPKKSVEINPYYRFYSIFQNLLSPDLEDYETLRQESLFHVIIHQIGENDRKQGMSRNEYYKKYLYKEILSGGYGRDLAQAIQLFSTEEHQVILDGLLKLYAVGASFELLRGIFVRLFANSILYHNTREKEEVLIYIGYRKTKQLEKKIQLILDLFLDFRFQSEIYHQYHFAILGVDDTCVIEEIALY